MKQLEINNISLSDYPIKEFLLSDNNNEVTIVSEGSFKISELKKLPETRIKIKNWKELRVSKYISKKPFEAGTTFEINWKENLETFDLIQEIILKAESTLILNGFSKQGNGWLTYEFTKFECDIEITKNSNL